MSRIGLYLAIWPTVALLLSKLLIHPSLWRLWLASRGSG